MTEENEMENIIDNDEFHKFIIITFLIAVYFLMLSVSYFAISMNHIEEDIWNIINLYQQSCKHFLISFDFVINNFKNY